MMKRILLPKSAFRCKGQEVVAGKIFIDGVLEVAEDVYEKVAPQLTGFYGCTVEDVIEPVEAPTNVDPSLAAAQTAPKTPTAPASVAPTAPAAKK